jgi:hypothetical protein
VGLPEFSAPNQGRDVEAHRLECLRGDSIGESPGLAPRDLACTVRDPRAPVDTGQLIQLQRTVGNTVVVELMRRHSGQASHGGHEGCPEEPALAQRSIVGDAVGEVGGALGGLWDDITSTAESFGVDLSALNPSAVGADVLTWLKSAGSSVWSCLKAFESKAADLIGAVGRFGLEKLSTIGAMAWTFISSIPVRFWRLVVDGWDGLDGLVSWLWTGLKGEVGAEWDAVTGVFNWLLRGGAGVYGWLADAVAGGLAWAEAFIKSPSLELLRQGMLEGLSWVWSGIVDFAKWEWNGLAAAAQWAVRGLTDFGKWLWDGVLAGLTWEGEVVLHLLEYLGVGEALEVLWGLLFRLRPLSGAEQGASASVHPAGLIPYELVRVDQDSLLIKIGTQLATLVKSKVSPGAITTMHIIHAPGSFPPQTAVHELTHVAQYQLVGAVYIPQALCAQQSAASYDYGDLVALKKAGKHFSDLNREQQADLCEDYYRVNNGLPSQHGGTKASLAPFIADMRSGAF